MTADQLCASGQGQRCAVEMGAATLAEHVDEENEPRQKRQILLGLNRLRNTQQLQSIVLLKVDKNAQKESKERKGNALYISIGCRRSATYRYLKGAMGHPCSSCTRDGRKKSSSAKEQTIAIQSGPPLTPQQSNFPIQKKQAKKQKKEKREERRGYNHTVFAGKLTSSPPFSVQLPWHLPQPQLRQTGTATRLAA